MVLTDNNISESIARGKIVIEPFNEKRLTPQGYDISLKDFILKPGEFKVFETVERIEVPTDLMAIPFLRTSSAFKGLMLSSGIVDAGFKGHLHIALYNSSKKIIKAETVDYLIPQIHLVFWQTDGKSAIPFGGRIDEHLS